MERRGYKYEYGSGCSNKRGTYPYTGSLCGGKGRDRGEEAGGTGRGAGCSGDGTDTGRTEMVDDFAGQIDLTNTQAVLQYGAGSQKKIADFSETALSNVRTKDMGEVGQLLTDVVAQLKDFDTEEDKGFFGLFKKSGDKLNNLKAKYDKAEVNISKICDAMENHQVVLLKDVAVLDKLYQLNLNYFKELSMYILAGKKKLTQAKKRGIAGTSGKSTEEWTAGGYAGCEGFCSNV